MANPSHDTPKGPPEGVRLLSHVQANEAKEPLEAEDQQRAKAHDQAEAHGPSNESPCGVEPAEAVHDSGTVVPEIPSQLSEDMEGCPVNLFKVDFDIASTLGEWTGHVKEIFKAGGTFGDLGRHLLSIASSLPTALGNFVRSYCAIAAQPSSSEKAKSSEGHGDLLPIHPESVTTDIEGVTPNNIDWVKLMIVCIDFHYCVGWSKPICTPFGISLSKRQESAISGLARTVTNNIVSAEPLPSLGECDKLLSSKKFDYAGKPIEYMEDLICERVLPAWPKKGQAGIQPIEDFLSPETKAVFNRPKDLLLPTEVLPKNALRSRVRATDHEWFHLVKEAASRGMMKPVDDSEVPRDKSGHLVTNGAGGVVKEKMVNGRMMKCQRFISIMCPVNAITEPISGSQDTLPYIGQMTGLMLEESESLYLESEDLQSAFNLFSIPPQWYGFFAYSKKVDQSAFGLPAGKMVRPCLSVVPMGWHSAVALVQEAVRELVFNRAGVPRVLSVEKSKPLPASKTLAVVYLDNFDEIRIIQTLDADLSDEGRDMSDHHRNFNRVCDEAGLPRNLGKQLIHAFSGGMQGGHFDGIEGVLKLGPDKLRNYIMLSLCLLSKRQWSEFHLRHWTGKTAFMATFKRSLFSGMGKIFEAVEESRRGAVAATAPVIDEIFILMCQSVLSQSNLRASLALDISCTDASPYGGGSGVATELKHNPVLGPTPVEYDGTCGQCAAEIEPDTLSTRYKCPSRCGRICCSIFCLSRHRKTCPRVDQPRRVFGERFSGPDFPLTKAAGLRGLHVQPPLDLLHPIDSWDFFTEKGKERLEAYVEDNDLVAEHWAPECKTFSAARGRPIWTSSGNYVQGPPALRSREKPWGLPNLKQLDQIKVRQGNAMAKRSLVGVREGDSKGKLESIEHPWNSWLWSTEEAMQLCEVPGIFVTCFSHCCYGGNRKWTCIVHNIPALHQLMHLPDCPGHDDLLPYEVHELSDGSLSFDTAKEAMYPWKMCRMMAEAIHQQIERQYPSPVGDMPFDSEGAIMSVLRTSTRGMQDEGRALAAAKAVLEIMRTMEPGREREHLKHMLRQAVADYINHLYQEGETLTRAGWLLSGMRRLYPRMRKELAISQQWYNNWARQHAPVRATPITWEVIQAFVGLSLYQHWPGLALTFLVGFTFFLRTQELLHLYPEDFLVDLSDGSVVLRIATSKTSRGAQQSVALHDKRLAGLIHFILQQLPEGKHLWTYSLTHFRNVFRSFCIFFEIQALNLVPYSLRRGGATAHYLRTNNLEAVMILGRWRDQATARIYLDDARATLVRLRLSLRSQRLLRHFRIPLRALVHRCARVN
eukprot:Skav211673  [mRNA]  locus=scaffold216:126980:131499:+ [translate_table: standard]